MTSPNSSQPALLTLSEAAEQLSVSPRTLYREISAGRFIRPVKIGRSSRIPSAALNAYIANLTTSSKSK